MLQPHYGVLAIDASALLAYGAYSLVTLFGLHILCARRYLPAA